MRTSEIAGLADRVWHFAAQALPRAAYVFIVLATVQTAPPLASGAHAQNFFERLFGVRRARPAGPGVGYRARRQRRRSPTFASPAHGFRPGNYFGPERSYPAWSYNERTQQSRRPPRRRQSGFRTVCVRMCDGYYFPISFSTSRNRFRRDASACSARCPGEGKLFYLPSPGSEIANAQPLEGGKRYEKLDIAFVYRKRRVKNCQCRPAPWSPSERLRHAMYGAETGAPGAPTVVAGLYPKPQKPSGDATAAEPATDDGKPPSAASETAPEASSDPGPQSAESAPGMENAEASASGQNSAASAAEADQAAEAEPPPRAISKSTPRWTEPKQARNIQPSRPRRRTSPRERVRRRETRVRSAGAQAPFFGLFAGGSARSARRRWPGD